MAPLDDQERYLDFAIENIETVKDLLQKSPMRKPTIALLAWQGAENSLKALQVPHNVMKMHDLDELMTHLVDNSVIDRSELTYLRRWAPYDTGSHAYDNTKYPPGNPQYWESKSREDLIKMVEAAAAFLKFSGEKLAIKTE